MDQMTEISLFRPKPSDLIAFLPFACQQLQAPFKLRILVETIEQYVGKSAADDKGKKTKREKATPHTQTSVGQHSMDREPSVAEQDYGDENMVVLRARCDHSDRPIELLLFRCAAVPRLLMKILGLCIPFHEQLAKITVRWAPLDGSVLYEIAKFLPLSHLTEISLDDSPVPHRNYHLLLHGESQLRSLSLARCDLGDEDCAALAARLVHPLPASRTLACLSLESNRIGDEGARALGEALRTNRSLLHLNLAGNAITNLGVGHILRSLAKFPLSSNELILKRRRTFEYLKLKKDAYVKCYRELTQSSEQASDGDRGRSRTTGVRSRKTSAISPVYTKVNCVDTLESRAEALAATLVGARSDPFGPMSLVTRGDTTYCRGNFNLTYLNFAYNDLDSTIASRLKEVLAYQAEMGRFVGPGLLRVVLEGNVITDTCAAARDAEELMERSLAAAGAGALLQVKPGRKSERPKFK